VAIYSFLVQRNPRTYLEVGSGHSTEFARRAINDHSLRTQVVSIDPAPRAGIDRICDRVVRSPLEQADLSVFRDLSAGDVVYIDNSHRSFMNSDVTVFFLDVLPDLPLGVLIGIDDIYLPDDYPWAWQYRYYSEQYLLAAYLLRGSSGFRTVLPCHFIGLDPDLSALVSPLAASGIATEGTSFWLESCRASDASSGQSN
jgi:hypothetical protein